MKNDVEIDFCAKLEKTGKFVTPFSKKNNSFIIDGNKLVKYTGDDGSVIIPEGIRTIGYSAFEKHTSIVEVMLPESLETIEFSAFEGCTSLSRVILPDGLKAIGHSAFRDCTNLTEIVLPNGLDSIDSCMFEGCENLKSIILPKSTSSIEERAFRFCKGLERIILPDGMESIGDSAFEGCVKLSSIIFPKKLRSIGSSAFSGCDKLDSIDFPTGLISIDRYSFADCSSLRAVVIPEGVIEIKERAFFGCVCLTDVTLPVSLQVIEREAFFGCKNLLSIAIPESVISLPRNAFQNTGIQHAIHEKTGGLLNEQYKFIYLDSNSCRYDPVRSQTVKWTLQESGVLTILGKGGISDYTGGLYSDDDIPAPWYGLSVERLVIEEGIDEIGEYAFFGLKELRDVSLPTSLRNLGKHAFEKCEMLETIFLPDGLERIESSVFKDCVALKSVHFPMSLRKIDRWAFSGCTSLTRLRFPDVLHLISSTSFWGVEIGKPDFIEASSRFSVDSNCLFDNEQKKVLMGADCRKIMLPVNTQEVKEYAFYRLKNLEEITLPPSVISIGKYAFSECPKLHTIRCQKKPIHIGKNPTAGSSHCRFVLKQMPGGVLPQTKMSAIKRLGLLDCTRNCAVAANGESFPINEVDIDIARFSIDAPFTAVAAGFDNVFVLLENGRVRQYQKGQLPSEEKQIKDEYSILRDYLTDRLARGSNVREDEVETLRDVIFVSANELTVACVLADHTVWCNLNQGDDREIWSNWRNVIQTASCYNGVFALFSDGRVATNKSLSCTTSSWRNIIQIDASGFYYAPYSIIGLQDDGHVRFEAAGKDLSSELTDWRDIIQVSCSGFSALGLKTDGTVWKYNGEKSRIICPEYKNVVAVRASVDADLLLLGNGKIIACKQDCV